MTSSKNLLLIALAVFFLAISSPINAQKTVQDLAELKDKKWGKLVKSYKNSSTWIDQLQGLLNEDLLKEENLPNPKKIGVLTMQVWDNSVTKSTKIGDATIFSKNFLTSAGSNIVADKFHNAMMPVFTAKFKERGISLLEPKDFLTNEENKQAYIDGANKVELSGLMKVMGSIGSILMGSKEQAQGTASATGYEFYPISAKAISSDFKAPASIGLIAEDLNLDAVLIITVDVSLVKNGKSMLFHGIETVIIGPINDDKSIEYKGRIGAGMMNKYRDGLTFSTVYFDRLEPFEIAKLDRKSGNIEEWYLEGLDTVTSRMTDDLITGMQKFIALDKSRK